MLAIILINCILDTIKILLFRFFVFFFKKERLLIILYFLYFVNYYNNLILLIIVLIIILNIIQLIDFMSLDFNNLIYNVFIAQKAKLTAKGNLVLIKYILNLILNLRGVVFLNNQDFFFISIYIYLKNFLEKKIDMVLIFKTKDLFFKVKAILIVLTFVLCFVIFLRLSRFFFNLSSNFF